MVPVKLVYLSYFVSSVYVISHSFTRGTLARDRQQKMLSKEDTCSKDSLSPTTAFLDTLLWQGLASVVIPGLVINRTCALSRLLLYKVCRKNLSKTVRKWTVTGIGLGSIPFIIHPIDRYMQARDAIPSMRLCVMVLCFSIDAGLLMSS